MESRLIFFKEIVGVISLKTELKYQYPMHLRAREGLLAAFAKFRDNDTQETLGKGAPVAHNRSCISAIV